MRNLYTDELRAEPIQRLIEQLQPTWALLAADIARFQNWLTTIATSGGEAFGAAETHRCRKRASSQPNPIQLSHRRGGDYDRSASDEQHTSKTRR